MYSSGLRVYLLDNYNWIDFIVLSVYLSSYVLRFLVDHRIKVADGHYNGTARAREAILDHDVERYNNIRDSIYKDHRHPIHSYFMKACTYPDDLSSRKRYSVVFPRGRMVHAAASHTVSI